MRVASVFDLGRLILQGAVQEPVRVQRRLHRKKFIRFTFPPERVAELRGIYTAHMKERRAAGYKRAEKGTIERLMARFRLDRNHVDHLLRGLR